MGALQNLEKGQIGAAVHDIIVSTENLWASLPVEVKTFLTKIGTSEYTILKGLIPTAIKDITTGGFTSAAFVKAGTDILAQLVAQNITTFTLQDIIANLNIAISVDPAAAAAQAAQLAKASETAVVS